MIDVTHEITTVQRQVGTRALDAGQARTISISRTYASDIDDVWDACTNPERIRRWFLPISGELREGGRYALEGNASGTIQRCDPPHGFDATWEYGDEVSWIELRLTPEPDGRTRFRLEHIAHVDDERWAQFGPGAVGVGWDLGLMGLGRHLQSGVAVDPREAAALLKVCNSLLTAVTPGARPASPREPTLGWQTRRRSAPRRFTQEHPPRTD